MSFRQTQMIIKNINAKTVGAMKKKVASFRKKRPHLFHGLKGEPIYTPVKTLEHVEDLRNAMACGNYPLDMTGCEVVGINGDCGKECPVLIAGDCDCEDEMLADTETI